MSTTPEDDNSRKHSRSDDGEEEKQHSDIEQENSPKRSRANSYTSAQPPTSTSASEGATESGIGTGNSGGHEANESNDISINTDTVAAVTQPSVVSTAPTAGCASLPHQEIPQCDVDEVDRKFREKFPVGKWYETREELEAALQEFADEHLFVMRREGERAFVCSRCPNTWSKKKAAKEAELTKKGFSGVTDCPVIVRHTKRNGDGKRVKIRKVVGLHNHPLDVAHVALSQRLSGRNIEDVLPLLAPHFAPLMKNNQKPSITTARNIITAHLGENVSIKADSIQTILLAVQKYLASDKYKQTTPIIDSDSMLSQFKSYIASDKATDKCSSVLDEVVTNSSGDTSWKVLQLLESLKKADPTEFDFRIHKDSSGNIDAFTWQTGVQRGAFSLYGDALFLDARKKHTMNVLGMKYITLVVIDANNKFWPISHTFAFAEDHDLYEFACEATLDMTPGRSRESVLLGYGDMFFDPEKVQKWFPNILMMIDAYHLIYAKNGQSILAKEFGHAWNYLREHFVKALEAETEDEFDKHIGKAIAAAGSKQTLVDKIVKWQDMGKRWGHFSRNTVPGHRNIRTSSYAEQNHSSLAAMAPDNANRTVEHNVADVMRRDKTMIEARQEDKYLWYTEATAYLGEMTQQKSAQLSQARTGMDRNPYKFFEAEFDHSLQYSATDEVRDGAAGCVVRHVSEKEGDGRFIPDGEKCNNCKESKAMTFCRHDITKCRHRGLPIFNPDAIDPVHNFYIQIPRMRTDGSWVSTITKRSSGHVSTDQRRVEDDTNLMTVSDDTNDGLAAASIDFGDPEGNGVVAEPEPETSFADVLSSPSKQLMPNTSEVIQRISTTSRKQVQFNTFVDHGKEIGGVARGLCLRTQHALNHHFQQVLELVRIGDYEHPRHEGTCVEGLANLLALVAKDRSSEDGNAPNVQVVANPGRKPVHRLGSVQSTVGGGMRPKSCKFCKRQGCQINTCTEKSAYGEAIKVTSASLTETGERLGQIATGLHVDFQDTAEVFGDKDIEGKAFLDNLPAKTKRVQVKGFTKRRGKQYLFCTCIDNNGILLSQKQGTVTTSFADIFINVTAVTTSLKQLDYVFLKSSV